MDKFLRHFARVIALGVAACIGCLALAQFSLWIASYLNRAGFPVALIVLAAASPMIVASAAFFAWEESRHG